MPDLAPPAPHRARSRHHRWSWAGPAALLAAVLAACSGSGSAAPAPGTPPRFVDDGAAAGVTHRYDGEFDHFVGGGVATFDCDEDGRADLYFAGGTEPAALYRNESTVGGALRFAPVPSPTTDLTAVTGAYPLDLDGDGHTDLAVLRHGGDLLLRGDGECTFAPAGEDLGLDAGSGWTTAFSATWEGAHALPTLAFGRYLEPDDQTCDDSVLVRPDATGARYAEATVLSPGYCPLSMLFSDWGRTGQRDLRVTNDRHYYGSTGDEQLWRLAPGAEPTLYTEADGWTPLQIWGMGIASQDLTGDGKPEVYLTSQGDNKLQTLADGASTPTYRDIALRRGVTAQRPYAGGDVLPSTAWHPEFGDVNNDGALDLLVTKGNVEAQPDHAVRDPSNLLIGQADGTFVEGAEAAGIVGYDRSRGAAVVDLNLDGLLDLVVVHRRTPPSLFRNVGRGDAGRTEAMGHWLALRLRQPAPNPDAVGAWVEVRSGDRTLTHEVTVGGGHASGELTWIHAGLGAADDAEVRVQWPDGETGPWMPVDADTFVTIERGASAPEPWTPEPSA